MNRGMDLGMGRSEHHVFSCGVALCFLCLLRRQGDALDVVA